MEDRTPRASIMRSLKSARTGNRAVVALMVALIAIGSSSGCSPSGAEAWDWTKDYAGAAMTDVGKALFYVPKGIAAVALLLLSVAVRLVPAFFLAAAAGAAAGAVVAALVAIGSRMTRTVRPMREVFGTAVGVAGVGLGIVAFAATIVVMGGPSAMYAPSVASTAASAWTYWGF